jgi:hypothetical protein
MIEVGEFDEVASLKWQMRMEGVMAASLNNTGSSILQLAANLQKFVDSQQAAAAAGVTASGLATVVGDHHCPDVGAPERTAAGIAELVVFEVGCLLPAATKAAATPSSWWDPAYWLPLDDCLVRSSRHVFLGVGGVPGQGGGGEAGLHYSRRLLLPPPWTICPGGMVVVGGTNGNPQGQGLHLAADRCPAPLFQLQGQRGRRVGSAGGGCFLSARGRGFREATAANLRPPRGPCHH